MAPPSRARQGFSKRAQLGLFTSYVIAVAGILIALLLALTARFDPAGHAAIQGLLSDVTSPVTKSGRALVSTMASGYDGVSAYIDAGSKNRAMEAELRQNRAALIEAKATARENHRLKRLARLIKNTPSAIVSAQLIASTGASARRYATLSAGGSQGIKSGQPVRTSEGLVGRVVAAGRVTARVLLITDGGAVVPVKRLSDGQPALATGRGDGGLDIRALQAGSNPFKVGDVFVTSGAGGIYPPDIPVALAKVERRDVTIARPLADPARLDFALVLPPYIVPDPALPPLPATP
jgi:rod shape-determining protein MreC